jgi:opacity protein-like surface antigen
MNKVQKLLLGLATTAALSSSFADVAAPADLSSQYYVTIGGGLAMQDKLSSFSGKNTKITFKKPKIGAEALFGVGYNVNEDFHVEAVFVKPFFGDSKLSRKETETGQNVELSTGKLKSKINSLQIRGYYDVAPIADIGKVYVGAGLGWSQVSAKATFNPTDAGVAAGERKSSGKIKAKNNFAWMVAVGSSFKVADGTRIGVEYNYQDFGKAGKKSDSHKPKFAGHAVVAKLMFDL